MRWQLKQKEKTRLVLVKIFSLYEFNINLTASIGDSHMI